MTPDLDNAIVTGASKGIGAAIARRLSHDGFQVVINYGKDEAAALALVRSLEDQGGKAIAIQGDVAETATHERLFEAAEKAFGPVGVLVNNAGTMRNAAIAEASDEDFDRQCAVNLGGVFRAMRLASSFPPWPAPPPTWPPASAPDTRSHLRGACGSGFAKLL